MPNKHTKTIFRQIDGVWQSVSEQTPRTLADYLTAYNLIIDDKCVFARFKIYTNNPKQPNYSIWYRAYSEAKITIDIWEF